MTAVYLVGAVAVTRTRSHHHTVTHHLIVSSSPPSSPQEHVQAIGDGGGGIIIVGFQIVFDFTLKKIRAGYRITWVIR